MKNLNQLISTLEVKANQDDYAIVSRDDLLQIVECLKDYWRLSFKVDRDNPDSKISLNSDCNTI